MRNRLSFMNAIFIGLLLGKIGALGKLGGIPWLIVFAPLAGDLLLDYCVTVGYIDNLILKVAAWIKIRQLNRVIKKVKDIK